MTVNDCIETLDAMKARVDLSAREKEACEAGIFALRESTRLINLIRKPAAPKSRAVAAVPAVIRADLRKAAKRRKASR